VLSTPAWRELRTPTGQVDAWLPTLNMLQAHDT